MLSCPTCASKNGAMQSSAHDCEVCSHSTYSAMKLCEACSLILDQCVFCRSALNLNLDPALVQRARDLASKLGEELALFAAEYDQTVAPIAPAIARFQSAQAQINSEADAARQAHTHVVTRPGGGSSLEAKSPEDEIAYDASRKKQGSDYQAAETELGAPARLLWDYAREKRRNDDWQANRIFDVQVSALVAMAMIPSGIAAELERITDNYKRTADRLVDPRLDWSKLVLVRPLDLGEELKEGERIVTLGPTDDGVFAWEYPGEEIVVLRPGTQVVVTDKPAAQS